MEPVDNRYEISIENLKKIYPQVLSGAARCYKIEGVAGKFFTLDPNIQPPPNAVEFTAGEIEREIAGYADWNSIKFPFGQALAFSTDIREKKVKHLSSHYKLTLRMQRVRRNE